VGSSVSNIVVGVLADEAIKDLLSISDLPGGVAARVPEEK
jgi:hypothetical protein